MPQAVDSLTSVVEQLGDRLRDLESRIASLESFVIAERLPQPEARPTPTPLVARRTSPPRRLPELESSARAFPTVGKAVLGFAGAFLLRALAESGSVPKLPVLIIAILYA